MSKITTLQLENKVDYINGILHTIGRAKIALSIDINNPSAPYTIMRTYRLGSRVANDAIPDLPDALTAQRCFDILTGMLTALYIAY